MKKIALDVDGVLLNFTESFDKAAEIVLKRKLTIHRDEFLHDHYHLAKRIDVDIDTVENILQYMLDSKMYANFTPLPGVKEALKNIKDRGYEISIVTALPESAKEMRLENLQNALGFTPDRCFFVGMGKSKEAALKELRPDIFVDDRIEYLANAPQVFHLVWCDQQQSQKEREFQVDVHVHSLLEWTQKYLPKVDKELDAYYAAGASLQLPIKLENHRRKYGM